jgi:hypothetical protein
MAVGYDDEMKIDNIQCKKVTTGALLIRNFWGKECGGKGCGWFRMSMYSMVWLRTGGSFSRTNGSTRAHSVWISNRSMKPGMLQGK